MVRFTACCYTDTSSGKRTRPGTASGLEGSYQSSWVGQTRSSFLSSVPTFHTHESIRCYTPGNIFKSSQPHARVTAISSALLKIGAHTVGLLYENREFSASLCHWWLFWRQGARRTPTSPEKIYKKNIGHPFSYLFREQEKETHEAVDRALQVGNNSRQVRISGRRAVVCRKCPVWPTTLSIYNQHVGPESTVQLPPLWASRWHRQSVSEHTVLGMNWSKILWVLLCCIKSHGHWQYSYTSQRRWIH